MPLSLLFSVSRSSSSPDPFFFLFPISIFSLILYISLSFLILNCFFSKKVRLLYSNLLFQLCTKKVGLLYTIFSILVPKKVRILYIRREATTNAVQQRMQYAVERATAAPMDTGQSAVIQFFRPFTIFLFLMPRDIKCN